MGAVFSAQLLHLDVLNPPVTPVPVTPTAPPDTASRCARCNLSLFLGKTKPPSDTSQRGLSRFTSAAANHNTNFTVLPPQRQAENQILSPALTATQTCPAASLLPGTTPRLRASLLRPPPTPRRPVPRHRKAPFGGMGLFCCAERHKVRGSWCATVNWGIRPRRGGPS